MYSIQPRKASREHPWKDLLFRSLITDASAAKWPIVEEAMCPICGRRRIAIAFLAKTSSIELRPMGQGPLISWPIMDANSAFGILKYFGRFRNRCINSTHKI